MSECGVVSIRHRKLKNRIDRNKISKQAVTYKNGPAAAAIRAEIQINIYRTAKRLKFQAILTHLGAKLKRTTK